MADEISFHADVAAWRRTRVPAEDAVHDMDDETFLRCIQRGSSFSPADGNHFPFILTHMLNLNPTPLATKLLPKRCEARESAVHGLGVFATTDIPDGRYITMYPCEAALWCPPSEMLKDSPTHHQILSFREMTASHLSTYAMGCSYDAAGHGNLAVVGNPHRRGDPHYLGHMINDGATMSRAEASDVYSRISFLKRNAMVVQNAASGDPSIYVVSTRDIDAGEEIFITYGAAYWLRHLNPVAIRSFVNIR